VTEEKRPARRTYGHAEVPALAAAAYGADVS
jgi:hypothetical protein